MFWIVVPLSVLGIERQLDNDGLTTEEIKKAKEAVICEL
jgi:hypothetical protein